MAVFLLPSFYMAILLVYVNPRWTGSSGCNRLREGGPSGL